MKLVIPSLGGVGVGDNDFTHPCPSQGGDNLLRLCISAFEIILSLTAMLVTKAQKSCSNSAAAFLFLMTYGGLAKQWLFLGLSYPI